MPNHIKNRLTFSGDEAKIKELVDRFSTNHEEHQTTSFDGGLTFKNAAGNFGWLKDGVFTYRQNGEIKTAESILEMEGYLPNMEPTWVRFPDFDKILPRPSELDITSDGLVMYIENEFCQFEPMAKLIEQIKKMPLESVENFAKAVINLKKYGHACWYGWSVEKWGTKWNCYDCEKKDGNVWEFDTAWSGVPKLIFEIAKAFPEIQITYEYSDEDTGSNCGIYVYEGGYLVKDKIFENGSKEAYEHAFKLRPDYAENFVLVDGKYEYKEDEDTETEMA